MKKIALFLLIICSITACSKKQKASGSFKLIVGNSALEAQMAGGSFVQTTDRATQLTTLSKLNSDNSIELPVGDYNFMFVTFAGPTEKSGIMYCSTVDNVKLSSSVSTVQVNLTSSACQDNKYTDTILKIKKGIVANWNFDNFNQSYWGP